MKKIRYFLILLLFVLTASACDKNATAIEPDSYTTSIEESSAVTTQPVQSTSIEPITSSTIEPTTTSLATSTTTAMTTNTTMADEFSTLSLITMNDTHGYIQQNDYGKRGISNLSYLINNVRAQNGADNVLLVANGDMFQGTGLVKMSYGEIMIDIMNQMGFDACCIGNHEFDWDLPKILQYFDGEVNNGEADFPLLNANIYDEYNELISFEDKVCPYKVFDKAGVRVAVIGYIGNVKSSINAMYADSYTFDTDIADSVYKTAVEIKDNDIADIIIVSIHDGESSGVSDYYVNQDLAMLKYNGEYLVDAVINGHTHTHQFGAISRAGGVAMPIIQTSGYSQGYLTEAGKIDLTINTTKKCVTNYYVTYINANDAGTNYDSEVENIIADYYEDSREELDKVYCINDNYISRYGSDTYEYIANVMLNATGADFVLCNTGGIRANIPAGKIGFDEIYMVNPFDNEIIIHECSKSKIQAFLDANEGYYFYGYADSYSDTLKVAVIDYVFFSSYYKSCYTNDYFNSHLILRDLLIEDLSLHDHIDLSKDTSALIEQILD